MSLSFGPFFTRSSPRCVSRDCPYFSGHPLTGCVDRQAAVIFALGQSDGGYSKADLPFRTFGDASLRSPRVNVQLDTMASTLLGASELHRQQLRRSSIFVRVRLADVARGADRISASTL